MTQWQDICGEIAPKLRGNIALADERPVIYVDVSEQCLHWIHYEPAKNRNYPVSTSANGLGNRLDSFKTPFGIHRIKQKIGGSEPPGMIFKGRIPTGHTCKTTDNRDEDEITSRILWLDGLEPGVNKNGVHDTFERYIYIHGTSDEKRIGQPVSLGCIRMKNQHIVELFEDVLVNDLVLIR